MTEHLLSTLGLALKAGAVAVGEEPVGAAARGKKARVIFTAQDAAASSVRRAYSFARAGSCLCLPFPAGKVVLGRSLGRTSVAMCALTDIGFAQSLVRKLAGADPETYGAAADALDIKAKRAHERRAEQLRHEKNLRQGKHRPHSGTLPEPPREAPEASPPEEIARPVRRERPEGRRDRVYKERSSRPPKSRRSAKKEAPGKRFENALPVKKGKGSRRDPGKDENTARRRRRDN